MGILSKKQLQTQRPYPETSQSPSAFYLWSQIQPPNTVYTEGTGLGKARIYSQRTTRSLSHHYCRRFRTEEVLQGALLSSCATQYSCLHLKRGTTGPGLWVHSCIPSGPVSAQYELIRCVLDSFHPSLHPHPSSTCSNLDLRGIWELGQWTCPSFLCL